jgi:hypothetical protein
LITPTAAVDRPLASRQQLKSSPSSEALTQRIRTPEPAVHHLPFGGGTKSDSKSTSDPRLRIHLIQFPILKIVGYSKSFGVTHAPSLSVPLIPTSSLLHNGFT